MEIQNILKIKFRRAITEVTPILKRRLTPHQHELFMQTLQIAQEGVLDSLEDILSGKEPTPFDDFEELIEDILNDEEE